MVWVNDIQKNPAALLHSRILMHCQLWVIGESLNCLHNPERAWRFWGWTPGAVTVATAVCCSSLQVIFSACELGVFDLLLKSQEPLSALEIALELGTSADGAERLLDTLVGIEILEVEMSGGTGEVDLWAASVKSVLSVCQVWCSLVKTALYSSTDVANLYLAKGSAKSLHEMIVYQSQTIYPLWNNVTDAVRLVVPAGRCVFRDIHQGDLCSSTRGEEGLRSIHRRKENTSI